MPTALRRFFVSSNRIYLNLISLDITMGNGVTILIQVELLAPNAANKRHE
jgi:hypothetical protein